MNRKKQILLINGLKKSLRIFFWFGSLSVWEFESFFLILFCWIWFDFESLFSFSLQPFKHKHCIFFSSLFRNGSVLFFFVFCFCFGWKKSLFLTRKKNLKFMNWNFKWIDFVFFLPLMMMMIIFFHHSYVWVGGCVWLIDNFQTFFSFLPRFPNLKTTLYIVEVRHFLMMIGDSYI